jgi:fumarylacetoacetate (FAA) hydrolase
MKLATYKDGSRDGQLVVVSRDLGLAHFATGIVTRMQALLDDWNFLSPQLEDLYATLNGGKARHAFAFDPRLAMAPLPRAPQWLLADDLADAASGDAADGAAPVLRQAGGDGLLGAHDDLRVVGADGGIDLGAGLAVATADLPLGCSAARALDGVRLLLLVNAWALRERGVDGASQPAAGFAPVAVTPDELGSAWQGGRAALRLKVDVNGRPLGRLDGAAAQRMEFGRLVQRAAAARPLGAGSLVGSGPLQAADPVQGFASRAQQRRYEAATDGAPRSPWLQPGDTVTLEAVGTDGLSVFGRLQQRVVLVGAAEPPALRGPGAARGAGGRATPAAAEPAEPADAADTADAAQAAQAAEAVDMAAANPGRGDAASDGASPALA